MFNKYFTIHFFYLGVVLISGMYIVNPGPKYPPTKGEVWPKVQRERKKATYYTFDPNYFNIKITNYTCETLLIAIERHFYVVKNNHGLRSSPRINISNHKALVHHTIQADDLYKGRISELKVVLTSPCEEYPFFGMNERYNLKVSKVSILESVSIWGIIRGLETFVQLFYHSTDYNEVLINTTSITDYPRYPHRGLLLDTSRHYISVSKILRTLDAMAMNKMNVFHWHIVDDQSFPYQSEKFPELSKKGAFHSSKIYTKEDIEMIVQYARVWGIRVIPEFDVPGHTRSWGAAYPSILTKCYSTDKKVLGLGPIDPISDVALNLLKDLFAEVKERFPDQFFHVGGDEVDLDCWRSNPKLVEYMLKHSLTAAGLHALFMKNAIPLLGNDTNVIVWQEVFDENVPLSKDTIIQVWKSCPIIEMIKVLKAGHRVLFSSDWYMSDLRSEWTQYYKLDPRHMVHNFITNATILSNIVGGEACMWGEMVDDRNVISRVWPRASAVAEKLWSSNPTSWDHDVPWMCSKEIPAKVYNRMEEHACRMIRRGIDAQPPSGPGFCIA